MKSKVTPRTPGTNQAPTFPLRPASDDDPTILNLTYSVEYNNNLPPPHKLHDAGTSSPRYYFPFYSPIYLHNPQSKPLTPSPGLQQHLQPRLNIHHLPPPLLLPLPPPSPTDSSPRPRLYAPPRPLSPLTPFSRAGLRELRCAGRGPQSVPREHVLPQLRDPGPGGSVDDLWDFVGE